MAEKFQIKDLNLYYGDFHALKNINMSIQEKEITAFIGPSGCGKSTFILWRAVKLRERSVLTERTSMEART